MTPCCMKDCPNEGVSAPIVEFLPAKSYRYKGKPLESHLPDLVHCAEHRDASTREWFRWLYDQVLARTTFAIDFERTRIRWVTVGSADWKAIKTMMAKGQH